MLAVKEVSTKSATRRFSAMILHATPSAASNQCKQGKSASYQRVDGKTGSDRGNRSGNTRQQEAACRSYRSTSAQCPEQDHHDVGGVVPEKCFSRREVTTKAVRDGISALPSKLTYCRSFNVSRICAYVEGLPIPSVSSSLMKDASVYLAGGFVLWASGVTSLQST